MFINQLINGVYKPTNYIVNGVYKPTNKTGRHHPCSTSNMFSVLASFCIQCRFQANGQGCYVKTMSKACNPWDSERNMGHVKGTSASLIGC